MSWATRSTTPTGQRTARTTSPIPPQQHDGPVEHDRAVDRPYSRSVSVLGRVSLRLRITSAFAAAMAVVLALTGTFLYVRLGHELDTGVDRGLRTRTADVTSLVQESDEGLARSGRLAAQGDSLAQILSPAGRVVDSTPGDREAPLLDAAELARVGATPITIERDRGEEPVRLQATRIAAEGKPYVVVVGASLEDRDEALGNLATLLLIGGPAALLLASLAGYALAAAALAPVERMRRQADVIQATGDGQRLDVSPADDEVGRLGVTLNAMLARLELALDRERLFVADASHELRTPLAILKTELELALRGGYGTTELHAALGSAAQETDRLVQLAEDLLVIARSDQGRLPIRRDDMLLDDCLTNVARRFRQRAHDGDRTLTVDAPPGLTLRADPLRVEQAVGNLVDNALRHGGRTVVLHATRRESTVRIGVQDDGEGFPPAFLPSAFERFTRADVSRARGGSGLGLAIVAAIAGGHGGTWGAANRDTGGASVWIDLPA